MLISRVMTGVEPDGAAFLSVAFFGDLPIRHYLSKARPIRNALRLPMFRLLAVKH